MSYYQEHAAEWGRAADAEIAGLTQELAEARKKLAECEEVVPPAKSDIGVCLHTNWRTSPYSQDDNVFDAVQTLGVKRVRTYLSANDWWGQQALFQSYRDAGVKVHVTIGAFDKTVEADKPKFIKSLRAVSDCVDSVAGFNEPDADGRSRSQWLPKAAAWHNWLYGAIKNDPELNHLLVLPGALQGKDDSPDDTQAYAASLYGFDKWNAHWYPGNVPSVEEAYLNRKKAWPGPTWITEFGGDVSRIPQDTAIRNISEVIRLHNGPGEAAFIYELLGGGEFGMFDQNFNPTPSGVAVINLSNNGVI